MKLFPGHVSKQFRPRELVGSAPRRPYRLRLNGKNKYGHSTSAFRGNLAVNSGLRRRLFVAFTPHQYQTQVRFWIPLEIPTDHDYMMPRLPENGKIKIPQVGTYFTL